jgi:hypothetical protein
MTDSTINASGGIDFLNRPPGGTQALCRAPREHLYYLALKIVVVFFSAVAWLLSQQMPVW